MLRTLALIATTATLMSAPAFAASYTLPTSELHTAQGLARFETKLRRASTELCEGQRGRDRANCFEAVRQEALDQLPRQQRLAYEQTRRNRSGSNIALASLYDRTPS